MLFQFFKNIDLQGLQTSLNVVIFSLFHSQAVQLLPPSAVKGLSNILEQHMYRITYTIPQLSELLTLKYSK